ncbi:MAG TPA: glycosyltransferase family 61 protein [Candidatus Eisenbacteria bacterium]|nr:glycosyltransferase family 61 protein [Candidatus Eisenbacteria bacterium]
MKVGPLKDESKIGSFLRSKRHLFERWSGKRIVMPRRWLGSQEYARCFSGRWHQVYDRVTVKRKTPSRYGRRVADFDRMLEPTFPDFGVLELEKGYVVGSHGWIVSKEGYWLPEHSWHGGDLSQMKIPRHSYRVIKLKGVCLSLASDWASSIYGHFLLHGLSRLDLFTKAGFALSDVDFFYCGFPDEHSRRMLLGLGIPAEKWILTAKDVAVQADVVLAASFPGTRWNYPKWGVEFLRQAFTTTNIGPDLRLYIPRNTTRRILNEGALLHTLNDHGFEIFDPPQHDEPLSYFARAEVVVGPTGSGLANLVFCRPGTRVLELIPSDQVSALQYTVAEAGGLEYGYLIGESTSVRSVPTSGRSPYDFCVDEEEFRYALVHTISREHNGNNELSSSAATH